MLAHKVENIADRLAWVKEALQHKPEQARVTCEHLVSTEITMDHVIEPEAFISPKAFNRAISKLQRKPRTPVWKRDTYHGGAVVMLALLSFHAPFCRQQRPIVKLLELFLYVA